MQALPPTRPAPSPFWQRLLERLELRFTRLGWQTLAPIALAILLTVIALVIISHRQAELVWHTLNGRPLHDTLQQQLMRKRGHLDVLQTYHWQLLVELRHTLTQPVPDGLVDSRFYQRFVQQADGSWRVTVQGLRPARLSWAHVPEAFAQLPEGRALASFVHTALTTGRIFPTKDPTYFFGVAGDQYAFLPDLQTPTFEGGTLLGHKLARVPIEQEFHRPFTPEQIASYQPAGTWLKPHWDSLTKSWVGLLLTPVHVQGKFHGYFGSDFRIACWLRAIASALPAGTVCVLLDEDQRILADTTVAEGVASSPDLEAIAQHRNHRLVSAVRSALPLLSQSKTGIEFDRHAEFSVAWVPELHASLVVLHPPQSGRALPWHTSLPLLLLIGTLCLLLSLLASLAVFKSRVGKPLQRLRLASEKVAAGNLNVRLDTLTDNELGELAHSFNAMVQRLAEREAELKRTAVEQEQSEKKMLEVQKLESLGMMAGGIAHDFNNLLTAIVGNCELARNSLPSDAPAHSYLTKIEQISQRSADLCKQLLAYSGKGRFQIRRIVLNDLIQETADLICVSIPRNVELQLALSPSLAPVEADATQLRQLILNLTLNAAEAIGTAPGSITLTTGVVNLSAEQLASFRCHDAATQGEFVLLQVHDTGSGMTPETLERVFDPFFTTKFTGRGLGLAAVLGIVRGHRGAIHVQSAIGQGSTFAIYLPVSRGEIAPDSRPPSAGAGSLAIHGTVLIVDDEEAIRLALAKLLQAKGVKVLTAVDGRHALELFEQHDEEISIVLMDLTMPNMDGVEATRRLLELRPSLPVFLMSGYNEQEAIGHFSGQALAGFMQKPFAVDELFKKLAAAARKHPPVSDSGLP